VLSLPQRKRATSAALQAAMAVVARPVPYTAAATGNEYISTPTMDFLCVGL